VGKVKALYAFDAERVALCEKAECAFTVRLHFLFSFYNEKAHAIISAWAFIFHLKKY
jgi:hypothetical protein